MTERSGETSNESAKMRGDLLTFGLGSSRGSQGASAAGFSYRDWPAFFVEPETKAGAGTQLISQPVAEVLRPARRGVNQLQDQDVARRSREVISVLRENMERLMHFGEDLDYLPRIRAYSIEGGAALLDWPFQGFRIGFVVETDPDESSWHLVSDPDHGDVFAFGSLSGKELETMVLWLLFFAVKNS